MMKVFFVDVYDPLSNNLYNNLQDIASRKSNCEIDFIGPIDKNNFYDAIKNKDSIKRVWTLNNYVFKIYNYIKSHKPDIIHYQFELRRLGLFKTGIKFPFLLYLSSLTNQNLSLPYMIFMLQKKIQNGHYSNINQPQYRVLF